MIEDQDNSEERLSALGESRKQPIHEIHDRIRVPRTVSMLASHLLEIKSFLSDLKLIPIIIVCGILLGWLALFGTTIAWITANWIYGLLTMAVGLTIAVVRWGREQDRQAKIPHEKQGHLSTSKAIDDAIKELAKKKSKDTAEFMG